MLGPLLWQARSAISGQCSFERGRRCSSNLIQGYDRSNVNRKNFEGRYPASRAGVRGKDG